MIYVVAHNSLDARSWLEDHGMDASDAVIVTERVHAQGRVLGSNDRIIRLDDGRELDDLVFYLQCHLPLDRSIPIQAELW